MARYAVTRQKLLYLSLLATTHTHLLTYLLAVLTYTSFRAHPLLRVICATVSRNVFAAAELHASVSHPAADPNVHRDRLFQTRFPVLSTVCLDWNSLPQTVLISDSLSLFKPNLYFIYPGLSHSQPAASASEVTTIWRIRNSIYYYF